MAEDYEALPFPPGTSPFRLKGLVYRRHVEYAEQLIPGGEKAVNAAFRSDEIRAFMQQRFLASSWYDALPIVPVWYVCAKLLGQTPVDFLRVRTRHQAENDIHGVYRLILKLASPEMVALRMPRAVAQYFDFGTCTATVARPGVARVEHDGIPTFLAAWHSIVGETYLRVALEIAGARTIGVRRFPPVETGKAHGLPIVKVIAEVRYAATTEVSDGA